MATVTVVGVVMYSYNGCGWCSVVMYDYGDCGWCRDVWLQWLWLVLCCMATVAVVDIVMYGYSGCGWCSDVLLQWVWLM